MTRMEAMDLVGKYFYGGEHEEDEAAGVEALKELIEMVPDYSAAFTSLLGGYYYDKENYDLAVKYYEMAASDGDIEALTGLGYIWYYGRTGVKDYEKAFQYYSKAAGYGDAISRYKLADMYKNGDYVEPDYEKYKEIIEELYEELKDENPLACPIGDILSRLAGIRKEEGKDEEALELLMKSEEIFALRLREIPFWGDLNVMKRLKEDQYKWTAFKAENFGLYDLFYLLHKPVKAGFRYLGEEEVVEALEEDGEVNICFNGKWFRSVDDFFRTADLLGERLIRIADKLEDFEIL